MEPAHTGEGAPPAAAPRSVRSRRRSLLGGLGIGAATVLVGALVVMTGGGSTNPTDADAVEVTGGGIQVVDVSLVEMDVIPGTITVDSGTRLVLDVTNDGSMRHDLAFSDGVATELLSPGTTERIDLGTVTDDRTGVCTVAGHKAAGMVMEIIVAGDDVAPASAETDDAGAHDAASIDPNAAPGPEFAPFDATLPPADDTRVHRVALRISDATVPVAPGRTQRMWTFGGTVPGPTLRGRVGDRFVVTVINDAQMPHSIDFHASALAPDGPMRTIDPGEELVYEFTAHHAGAWMYHCATAPMIQHIGQGMYGSVIIDPPDLAPVDAEFGLVQSELYLGEEGGHGDVEAMADGSPDAVVFNGYYDQYRHAPLTAAAGDRVRIWLVNAGIERTSSFHVVGTQFDTVFSDGSYLVRAGNADAAAAQALAVQPGQGGFVEFTIPEAGHYPFLSHVVVDANRGATGAIDAAS